MEEIDIWRTATLLIRQYGDDRQSPQRRAARTHDDTAVGNRHAGFGALRAKGAFLTGSTSRSANDAHTVRRNS